MFCFTFGDVGSSMAQAFLPAFNRDKPRVDGALKSDLVYLRLCRGRGHGSHPLRRSPDYDRSGGCRANAQAPSADGGYADDAWQCRHAGGSAPREEGLWRAVYSVQCRCSVDPGWSMARPTLQRWPHWCLVNIRRLPTTENYCIYVAQRFARSAIRQKTGPWQGAVVMRSTMRARCPYLLGARQA